MPEPTNTPSAPRRIIRAASAGVAMPPAQKSTTGRRPCCATSRTRSSGARSSLAALGKLGLVGRGEPPDLALDRTHVAHRLHHVAGARLALAADHRGALRDPPERLTEIRGAADERNLEGPLVDVVRLVGRGEHLGLVDVVHLERLEHLCLHEVADPGLGHHRDGHGLLDLLDLGGIGHPSHATGRADVGGHALERHHSRRAGALRDEGMLGRDDVHDHPALEHLGEPGLDPEGRDVPHVADGSPRRAPCHVLQGRFVGATSA